MRRTYLDTPQNGWHNLLPNARKVEAAWRVSSRIIPGKRSVAMASIPIHNETEYTLTDEMTQQIIRDAQEHFGEEVRSIRVQYGIERHAFNARTREVRYAFSPNDFGLVDTTTAFPDTYYHGGDLATIDDEIEEESVPVAFDDVETDEEEPRETSLESLEADLEEDEEDEEEFPEMDDQFEDPEEEDSFMYDDEEEDYA
jgi:hypothetical protein